MKRGEKKRTPEKKELREYQQAPQDLKHPIREQDFEQQGVKESNEGMKILPLRKGKKKQKKRGLRSDPHGVSQVKDCNDKPRNVTNP